MRRTIAAAVFLCLSWPGMAQEHHHPPEHEDLHTRFYADWMRPDQPNVSCCDKKDCAPAQSRRVAGRWQAKRDIDAEWRDIPESKIELNRDSPDGRSHLCAPNYSPVGAYCFIPGSGS